MPKKANCTRNWKHYNKALVERGSITLWFNEETIKGWVSEKRESKKGRPLYYTDIAILCALTVKALYRLPFRAAEGMLRGIFGILRLDLPVPDYSLLCKRQRSLKVPLFTRKTKPSEPMHIVVDSTGIKVFGEGEWMVRTHGKTKHRLWRKLHIAYNADTHEVEAFTLTDLGVQDCQGYKSLLKEIDSDIAYVKADGAYDRFSCYEESEKKGINLITPPQRNARTSKERPRNKKKASPEAVKKRDQVIERIRELGREAWKEDTCYHERSLAETAMFRIKNIFGNSLSSRHFINQKIEMAIRLYALNKMTALGMPSLIALN